MKVKNYTEGSQNEGMTDDQLESETAMTDQKTKKYMMTLYQFNS